MKQTALRRTRMQRMAGITCLVLGVVFLVVTGGYYAYGVVARSGLDRLSYSSERPAIAGEGYVNVLAGGDETEASGRNVSSVEDPNVGDAQDEDETVMTSRGGENGRQVDERVVVFQTETASGSNPEGKAEQIDGELGIRSNEELPDSVLPVRASGGGDDVDQVGDAVIATVASDDKILSMETDNTDIPVSSSQGKGTAFDVSSVDPNFFERQKTIAVASAIEASIAEAAMYSKPTSVDILENPFPATKIRIPAINVDSDVKDLQIRFLADSYAWETPNKVVGHIPTTAHVGEDGQGWYFGHLESFVLGEGNVFLRLPEISTLLNENPIYIFLGASDRNYLYQVYHVETVHEDDLRITDSSLDDITLVTCVPRFYYDHRLLVSAALVGISDSLSTRESETVGVPDSG